MEGDSLQVDVPLSWARPSTTGVYKVIENSNLTPEKNQHQSDNIFGRYVEFELHNTRSSHESRHGHISLAEFELYNKFKEINFAPMSENRISGYGDRFNQNDFIIDTIESTKSCQNVSELSQESSLLELTRVICLIHYISSGTCKNSVKISQQQRIVCLRNKMNNKSVITLSTKSGAELTWWIENLRFCNG